MVEDMKVELEDQRQSWSQKGCTIMTDGWTDRRNKTLLNLLVSCGGSMFLKSIDAFSHVKNVTYLCEAIEEVIQEVGKENVVQVVTDNAASFVAAGKLLMERHLKFFWSPCVAHFLDFMLEDIGKLEWVKSIVEKAKNIGKFIYNHALVLSIMRQYTGQKELACLDMMRFASNFLTLKSLMKSKVALRCMFVGEEWTSSSYVMTIARIDVVNYIFDEPDFWTSCGEIVQVIEPLVVLLRVVDGEKPSMGYRYEGMDRAKEAIRSIYVGDEDKHGSIWDIIDRRWQNQLHRPIHATTYYLNPAFRFCDDFKADEEVFSGLYIMVHKLCIDGTTSSTMLKLDKYNNQEGAIFTSSMCIEARTQLQPDVIEVLLDKRPEPDIEVDIFNQTRLHMAVSIVDSSIMNRHKIHLMGKMLIEKDNLSCYAVDQLVAVKEGNTALVEVILNHSSDCLEMVDNDGRNALHLAVNNAPQTFERVRYGLKTIIV